jgi:outer membrane receptor protein involved in Fe transport
VFSGSFASVLNNRTTNEFKVGHVRESLLQGPRQLFDDDWKFIGFHGVDPFDVGSQNTHPDYIAASRNTYAQDLIRDVTIDDTLTWIAGAHNLKAGVAWSRNGALPQGTAANFIGLFTFPGNAPFNVNDPRTYPYRFGISMGQFDFRQIDHRASGFVSDKWAIGKKLTLNIGARYDWQNMTPETKDAIGPRLGPCLRRLRRRKNGRSRRHRQGVPVSATQHSSDAAAAPGDSLRRCPTTPHRLPIRARPARSPLATMRSGQPASTQWEARPRAKR